MKAQYAFMTNYDDNNHTQTKGTKEIQALLCRSNFCVQKKAYKKLATKTGKVCLFLCCHVGLKPHTLKRYL